MIQEIKIKNFLSFKDEVTFSFLASEDKFAEESQVVQIDENTRLLRFAVLYGYNASGKSNLIRAFGFLKHFWKFSATDLNSGTDVLCFKLDRVSLNDPTKFELIFYVERRKYLYQLELNEKEVLLEKLSYFKGVKEIMLFERRFENNQSVIYFNDSKEGDRVIKAAQEEISLRCLKNISFFVARNQVNVNLPLIDAAINWLRKHIFPPIYPQVDLTSNATNEMSKDKKVSERLVDFLNEADFNITNIALEESENSSFYQIIVEHTVENENGIEKYWFPLKYESLGTKRIFGLAPVVNKAIDENKFLAIDEIDNSLHNQLLYKLLFDFLKADSTSQLIVTTHNDSLLELVDDLIRKDSVYFVEKDKAGVTDLYKLIDFKGVDELPSIRSAYRYKRFGATMK
jgi:AAA15 family ATPase/GTPase